MELNKKYDYIMSFVCGFAVVKLNGKCGLIDKSGKEIIPCKYSNVSYFIDGFAAVQLNNKWGFVDQEGKQIVECKYDDVCDFKEGFAAVQLNGKWGFIDKTGNQVVECKYTSDEINVFCRGELIEDVNLIDEKCFYDDDLIKIVISIFKQRAKNNIKGSKSEEEINNNLERYSKLIKSLIEKHTQIKELLNEKHKQEQRLLELKEKAIAEIDNIVVDITALTEIGVNDD